jgi:carbon-monoxide dehydrogenase small subunit
MNIKFTLNTKPMEMDVPENITLLHLLRDLLGMTGTKCGCEIGECGACSVILDGKLVNSCQVLAPRADGCSVLTIEGIRGEGNLPNDLQENFIKFGAVQCGFCTPGMILAGEALLAENLSPTRDQIRYAISGNLCRCTGYQQIVDAIQATAEERKSEIKKGNS